MDTKNNYVPVGPLTDKTIYIERKADNELFNYVHSMEYVMIVEPRQQGKTSLIRHLMATSPLKGWNFVYVDVSTLDTRSEQGWYQTLSRRICKDLNGMLETIPDIPGDNFEWRDFLSEIALHACRVGKKIVIVLDEIGGANFDNNTLFFASLREIYNTRQVLTDSEFQNLSFILVGSFHPKDLIKDAATSPFNIAQGVHIDDFTAEQTQELVRKRYRTKIQVTALAESIHSWANGQPYLTQYLCSLLQAQSTPADVNLAVEKLLRDDKNNLSHIVKVIKANNNLHEYILKILKDKNIPYSPIENAWQDQLYLLGLIKTNNAGNCEIRNKIYQKIISDLGLKRKGVMEYLAENRVLPVKILNIIFVIIPRAVGRFVLDTAGRDKAAESTCILMGYSLIVVLILALWGVVDYTSLITFFTSWWRFFFPV